MDGLANLVFDSSMHLCKNTPEQHAQIRQELYQQLNLPFSKQLTLYTKVLGPVSSGKLECPEMIKKAIHCAVKHL
jgi:hypothetical protein